MIFLGEKKMGRPTDNPKPYKIAVKLDQEAKDILDAYCEQESVSIMEGARRGIKRLKPDLKKWKEAAHSQQRTATSSTATV